MTDNSKPPEKVFIRFNQTEDYYKKSSYGGEVIIADHFDSLSPPRGVWSEYISIKEHKVILAETRAGLNLSIIQGYDRSIREITNLEKERDAAIAEATAWKNKQTREGGR